MRARCNLADLIRRLLIVIIGIGALGWTLTYKTVSRDVSCSTNLMTPQSIDSELQLMARRKLDRDIVKHSTKSGLVIVQEMSTGKILVATVAHRQGNELCNGSVAEIAQPYEPGSVIKTLTMATALDQKALTLGDTFYNSGSMNFGGIVLMNAVNLEKQQYTYQEMITKSINVGAVSALRSLGAGNWQKAKHVWRHYLVDRFHFGVPYKLFTHEPAGYIPDMQQTLGNDARFAYTSFGIGMTASPLQIVSAYSAVLNDGVLVAPTLQSSQPRVLSSNIVSSQTSRIVREMLQTTAETSNPTALRRGFKVGGKSGTGPLADAGGIYQYNKSSGTYVGYIGKDNPEFSMLVKLDEPESDVLAGVVAARLWAQIAQEVIRIRYE